MNTLNTLLAATKRRSVYALNKELPVSEAELENIVKETVLHTPSAFNSQSSRLVLLLGEKHNDFWNKTEAILKELVGDGDFSGTKARIDGFRAGAGTVLFFEDQTVVKGLQEQFAMYAENFPIWSEHTSAMHQYALWLHLTEAGMGANLQHYNPLVDSFVQKDYNVPETWKLRAQMVFGGVVSPAGEKQFAPVEDRLIVLK